MWDLFTLVLETTRTFALKRGVGNGMMNGKDFDCRDRARRKSLRLADARVGRVECAEMQHFPSAVDDLPYVPSSFLKIAICYAYLATSASHGQWLVLTSLLVQYPPVRSKSTTGSTLRAEYDLVASSPRLIPVPRVSALENISSGKTFRSNER